MLLTRLSLSVVAVANAMPDFHQSMKDSLRTPEQGADTVVWLAISEAAATKPSGSFFQGRQQETQNTQVLNEVSQTK